MKLSRLSVAILTVLATPVIFAETTSSLNQIVVTANNIEQTIHSVTSNITVITAEEIQARQHKTLGDVLQTVPGMFIRNQGGLGTLSTMTMRGLSGLNILVLKNGIILNDPTGLSGANINHLFLSDVERIEIIKGPQSGVWGADTSAGVINIITKRAQQTATVSLETGSYGYKKLASSMGAGNDKINFIVNFLEISTDGFSAIKSYNASNNAHEKDAFKQTDVSFKMSISPLKGHKVQTFIKQSSATVNYDNTWPINPDATLTGDFDSTLKSIRYSYQNELLKTEVFLNKTAIDRRLDTFNALSSVKQYGVSGQYIYFTDQFFSLAISERKLQDKINNNSYTNTGFSASNTNQFFNRSLIFTQSIRADKYDRFDDKTTGKIGIKGYLSEQVFLAANYGTGYRAPTLAESAHSTLKPESTEGLDATIGAYGFELTYFKTKTQDKIQWISGWPITVYRNLAGTTTSEGIEASYRFTIDSIDSDININYTFQKVRDHNDQWLARMPEKMANLTFDNYSFNNTRLGISAQYMGTTYDRPNQQRAQIGEYFIVDFSADYTFNKHLTLYGKIENVFNKDYTNAVASYQGTSNTPSHIYNRGGTQLFLGIQGQF